MVFTGSNSPDNEQSLVERIAQLPILLDLAHGVFDSIPELCGAARSFLEAVGVVDAEKHSISVANAEKHFQAAHEFWMNQDFVHLVFQLSDEKDPYPSWVIESFSRDTVISLQHSRFDFIRNDPSLKEILIETDPSVRMRGAISILIRYWCMEFMLEEYIYKQIGLYALGLDISLEDAAVARETSARESKRSRPIAMSLNEFFSPIKELVNVRSIRCLARDVERYPKLVELVEELLKPLEDNNVENKPYIPHCEAMWKFWWNQDFRVLMREHLLKDPHLLVMVKMFSDRFKREITMERLQHITSSTELRSFYTNGSEIMKEPVEMIRCAFTFLMRYCACVGAALRLREKWGARPFYQKIKYAADLKDEKIGDVFYYPVQKEDPDVWLTHWYEANQTEINLLLDKEWRDVLTGRYSLRDEAEIKSLLEKIDVDTRMKLVLKKDSVGNLCMTCAI